MIKQFFCVLVLLMAITTTAVGQKPLQLNQLPAAAQTQLKQIAAKHRTGPVNYTNIEMELKGSGIDFFNMPVEDAIMMMFMLIAEDARKDTKDLLNEMDATRKKKAAMRETANLMKRQIDSLKNRMRVAYKTDSLSLTKQINDKQGKLQQITLTEKETITAEKNIVNKTAAAEAHQQSVELSIKELQQKQDRKRRQ